MPNAYLPSHIARPLALTLTTLYHTSHPITPHTLTGRHPRSRLLVHEPETPAAVHQEEDKELP